MNIAVINLAHREDRRAHMERQLGKQNVREFKWIPGLPGGRFGCVAAHVLALHYAIDSGADETIILEDDVILQPNFADYHVENAVPLFLGGEWTTKAEWKSTPSAMKPLRVKIHPGGIHRSHAYQVTPNVAEIILKTQLSPDGHYDHSMSKNFPWVEAIWPFPVLMAKMGSDVS